MQADNNAIAIAEPIPAPVANTATVAEIKSNVQLIQQCLHGIMKKGTHYDAIPGCGDKQTLLKPGAEVILTTFRIAAEPSVEETTDGFDHTYRITVRGIHIPTGNIVGYGVGQASTDEKKYKWRAAVCDKEYDNTLESHRQIAYIKDRSGAVKEVKQVRQNPADILNTVLKMAKKRALVDLCLTATACSDIFVQDLDDPDIAEAVGVQQYQEPAPRYQAPQRKAPAPAPKPQQSAPSSNPNAISEAQRKRLYAIGKGNDLTIEEMSFIVYSIAGVNDSSEIDKADYEDVCDSMQTAVHGQVIPGEA